MAAMQSRLFRSTLLLALVLCLCPAGRATGAGEPVVRAVLFYSPTCPACHQVITEDLPPLLGKYGPQLQIVYVNAADPGGAALYDAATALFGIPPERMGVPRLVVGDTVLVGSLEIPGELPGLIERSLASGGVDWPAIPALERTVAALRAAEPIEPPSPAAGAPVAGEAAGTLRQRLARDPTGNGLAIAILAGMVAAVVWVLSRRPWRCWRSGFPATRSWRDWAVPLLALAGLAVAGYLAYVETQDVEAVCGPIGDCHAVQQSEYARLFGVIPVGVVGVVGYLAILAAWTARSLGTGPIRRWAGLALCLMAAFGVLFSIYLTSLEPFVIGATCSWCLASAVIMTLILVLIAPVAAENHAGRNAPRSRRRRQAAG